MQLFHNFHSFGTVWIWRICEGQVHTSARNTREDACHNSFCNMEVYLWLDFLSYIIMFKVLSEQVFAKLLSLLCSHEGSSQARGLLFWYSILYKFQDFIFMMRLYICIGISLDSRLLLTGTSPIGIGTQIKYGIEFCSF